MKCKYGKLPEFIAEEINELSALARDMEYYADINSNFYGQSKNELRERLEDY